MTTSLCALLCVLNSASPSQGASQQKISFRLDKPQAAYFSATKEASANAKTLKQLGCTAKQHGRDGHFEVTYECPQWQTITLKDALTRTIPVGATYEMG